MFAGPAVRRLSRTSRGLAGRRHRGKDVTRYDLRPLVQELAYTGPSAYGQTFTVAIRAEPGTTGGRTSCWQSWASRPRRVASCGRSCFSPAEV